MRSIWFGVAVAVAGATSTLASAQPDPPKEQPAVSAEPSGMPTAGFGFAIDWRQVSDPVAGDHTDAVPTLVGALYVPLSGHKGVYLRPGLSVGYSGFSRGTQASQMTLDERDTIFGASLGLTYDATIRPAVTLGTGAIDRTVEGTVDMLTPAEMAKVGTSWLPFVSAQVGLGVPLFRSRLAIEPYGQYQLVIGDDRIHWSYGIEVTFQVH